MRNYLEGLVLSCLKTKATTRCSQLIHLISQIHSLSLSLAYVRIAAQVDCKNVFVKKISLVSQAAMKHDARVLALPMSKLSIATQRQVVSVVEQPLSDTAVIMQLCYVDRLVSSLLWCSGIWVHAAQAGASDTPEACLMIFATLAAGSSSFIGNEDLTRAIKRIAMNIEGLRLRNIFREFRSTTQEFSYARPREVSRGMQDWHHLITSTSKITLGRVLNTSVLLHVALVAS